jgi:hypothetical protein
MVRRLKLSYQIFWVLVTLEGVIALSFLLKQPASMDKNSLFLGLSASRLAFDLSILAVVLACAGIFVHSLRRDGRIERLISRLDQCLEQRHWLAPAAGALVYILLLALAAAWLLNSHLSPRFGMLVVAFQRTELVYIWFLLIVLQILLALVWVYSSRLKTGLCAIFNPQKAASEGINQRDLDLASMRLVSMVTVLNLSVAALFNLAMLYFHLEVFSYFSGSFACASLLIWWWFALRESCRERSWYRALSTALMAAAVFFIALIVYRTATIWGGQLNTPSKSYFDQLAEAWLHGRLYLMNTRDTHDLTLFQGNWYVANPPLVAILLTPVVALAGLENVNTVMFSVIFGAINVGLVFLILEALSDLGWSKLRTNGNLWLTLLFGFGTVHWWVSLVGKMWFLSDTCSVTFLALATLLALKKRPAPLVGLLLGLAMLARPHVGLIWLFLLGITAQHLSDQNGRLDWRRWFTWGVLSAIPLAAAAAGLLGYNYIRFGSILDYGYANENVADFLYADLHTYGTFHPHYILRNLRVMFLGLPIWKPGCSLPVPLNEGMSIFLTTPALIYVFRSFRRKPWMVGAWASVLSLLVLLANYYNTGAIQFGYIYLLDFILPVMALLAYSAGERVSGWLKGLIVASVVVNACGVLWWFALWC